jgi:hypothetical protein
MIAAERYMRSRCTEPDPLGLPLIGDEALILVGDLLSDAALQSLCSSCKPLSPGSRGRGIGRKELLGHRTDVLDDLTALINTVTVKIFASAEKLMLESYLHDTEVSGSSPEEPSVGYRFVSLFNTLSLEQRSELHKEFIQGLLPAEKDLQTLERYSKGDCAIVGSNPSIHLQVKGTFTSMPWPRQSSVAGGVRVLEDDEGTLKCFLKSVFHFVRPEQRHEMRPQSTGRPTWTKSLAIIKEGDTCSTEAKDNTTELLYSGLMCPLSRTMDQDQIPLDSGLEFRPAHPCWWTISNPGQQSGWSQAGWCT